MRGGRCLDDSFWSIFRHPCFREILSPFGYFTDTKGVVTVEVRCKFMVVDLLNKKIFKTQFECTIKYLMVFGAGDSASQLWVGFYPFGVCITT